MCFAFFRSPVKTGWRMKCREEVAAMTVQYRIFESSNKSWERL